MERVLLAAIASMRTTNALAARILRSHGPVACTDITGFGLAGHLREMLDASGVGAVLWQAAIPALPGARELAAQGIESSLAPDNRQAVPGLAGVDLLADPQTSGGLLVGVPAVRVASCLRALQDAGVHAAEIGEVEPMRNGETALRLE
jgi:selenide,water dikinase